jgi:hypothetical protein
MRSSGLLLLEHQLLALASTNADDFELMQQPGSSQEASEGAKQLCREGRRKTSNTSAQ